MSSCHAVVAGSSPSPQQALQQLQGFIDAQRARAKPVADLEQFERELHERVLAVEREAIAVELAKLDVDQPIVMIGGVPHRTRAPSRGLRRGHAP